MEQVNKNLETGAHNWDTNPASGLIPFQLEDFISKVIRPMNLRINNAPSRDDENLEYGGTSLSIDGKKILFRVAKTTPTKVGQFVAMYKRQSISDKIIPIDINDNYDYVFIASFNSKYHGVFIFNKEILTEKGIFAKEMKGGKLSFRVYAPWVDAVASQAKQTQNWQCKYFLMLDAESNGEHTDIIRKSLNLDSPKNEVFKQFEERFE
jgi:hypothetical protein